MSPIQKQLHKILVHHCDRVCNWYDSKIKELPYTIYSSYDIRDSGYKVANVDANIYPAGFNNICPTDKETSVDLMKKFLKAHYPDVQKICLATEEHTGNPFYLENVATLEGLLVSAGYEVMLAFPKQMEEPLVLTSATGRSMQFFAGHPSGKKWKEFSPQLILSNNDFSVEYADWAKDISIPIMPPRQLGWYQRQKSRYFKYYNQLAHEFGELVGLDPFLFNVRTDEFLDFDIQDDGSRKTLAEKVDDLLETLKKEYQVRGIDQKPFAFVKNNAGTYGLAVIRVSSGQDVLDWTYKSRKKMKAAKGGRDVEEVIIQEGLPSIVQSDGVSAEPVIYMIGKDLAGGFLRTHSEKNSEESLNSPGAVYKRMCVSDLAISVKNCPNENVYGWSAKLGLLAIAMEAQEMKAPFPGWKS